MKNVDQVCKAWVKGESLGVYGTPISTSGSTIFSYKVKILFFNEKRELILNVTKYSATTTKHQTQIRKFLNESAIQFVERQF